MLDRSILATPVEYLQIVAIFGAEFDNVAGILWTRHVRPPRSKRPSDVTFVATQAWP
jgi:hypothetical protein